MFSLGAMSTGGAGGAGGAGGGAGVDIGVACSVTTGGGGAGGGIGGGLIFSTIFGGGSMNSTVTMLSFGFSFALGGDIGASSIMNAKACTANAAARPSVRRQLNRSSCSWYASNAISLNQLLIRDYPPHATIQAV